MNAKTHMTMNIHDLQHKCLEMTLIFNPCPYNDP